MKFGTQANTETCRPKGRGLRLRLSKLYVTFMAIKCRRTGTEEQEIAMALSRKFLSALGIEADKIDEIISAHTETVDALKEERDKYKADADKLPGVQKELDDLKKSSADGEGYKKKYEDEHTAFEAYKAEVAQKDAERTKQSAYRDLLKKAGIADKRLDTVLKVSDLSKVELDEDGKIKDSETVMKGIKAEWADFIATETKTGADVSNPPDNTHGNTFDQMSLADKMKYANEHPNDEGVKAWLNK